MKLITRAFTYCLCASWTVWLDTDNVYGRCDSRTKVLGNVSFLSLFEDGTSVCTAFRRKAQCFFLSVRVLTGIPDVSTLRPVQRWFVRH